MKKTLLILIFLSCIGMANNLPELGDYSSSKISENEEIFIGRQILFQVNQSDSIIRDIEISDYLDLLGKRLINASTDPAKKIEFFIVNDSSINAFAMQNANKKKRPFLHWQVFFECCVLLLNFKKWLSLLVLPAGNQQPNRNRDPTSQMSHMVLQLPGPTI